MMHHAETRIIENVFTRREEIGERIDFKLESLGDGEVLDVPNLTEEEMNHFISKYNNQGYCVIDSGLDKCTAPGEYYFSLIRRPENA